MRIPLEQGLRRIRFGYGSSVGDAAVHSIRTGIKTIDEEEQAEMLMAAAHSIRTRIKTPGSYGWGGVGVSPRIPLE